MNDSDDVLRPRRVIVDLPRGRLRERANTKQKANLTGESNPIEMASVIRAAREYAQRTHSIGALQGAYAIECLIERIRSLCLLDEQLKNILADGDHAADELRSYIRSMYKD